MNPALKDRGNGEGGAWTGSWKKVCKLVKAWDVTKVIRVRNGVNLPECGTVEYFKQSFE